MYGGIRPCEGAMSSPETLTEYRKARMRERLMKFLLENLLPDYIHYDLLETVKSFTYNEIEEYGSEYGAFCAYYELGRWFETKMEDCDFDLDDFFAEYAKEIERRCDD